MDSIALHWIDVALILVYLVAVVALGLWISRGVKSSKDFFLAGKSLPWWAVGMSLVVSDIGAKDMIGLAGDGYRYGITMMNFDFIGCIFPLLVAAFLFMPFLWMAGIYTIPEYLGRRYNQYVRTLFAILWTCFMVGTLGTIFVSAAEMSSELLGWQADTGIVTVDAGKNAAVVSTTTVDADQEVTKDGKDLSNGEKEPDTVDKNVETVDWRFWVLVIATAVVVGLYTTIGGLKAVVVTDSLSCFVLIIGAALICILGLVKVGGISGLREKVDDVGRKAALEQKANDAKGALEEDAEDANWTRHHFSLLRPADDKSDYPWPAVLLGLGFVLGPAYWIGNQAIVQRSLGTKSQSQARASYLCCAGIKLMFPILLVLPGLIGLALFHERLGPPGMDGWEGNRVLPMMVVELLPTGVLGLVMGAFLAGVLSNLDSYVNSASTLFVTDLYKPVLPNKTDEHYLFVGRLLVVVFLVFGVAVSYLVKVHFRTVFEAFQTILSFFQGPLLALLLLGMLTRRTTQWGGFFGMILGVATAVVMHFTKIFLTSPWVGKHVSATVIEAVRSPATYLLGTDLEVSYLWVAWWSFVAAMLGTIIVSLFTKPYDPKRLEGLVCWIPVSEEPAE